MEEAYSLECKKKVTPKMARELFKEGLITDGSKFTCSDPNCNGKVTCVNIAKKKEDRIQPLHFTSRYHSNDCEDTKEDNKPASKGLLKGGTRPESPKGETRPDVFHLAKPDKPLDKKGRDLPREKPTRTNKKTGPPDGASRINGGGGSNLKSLKSLVTRFVQLYKQDRLSEYTVDIDGKNITYENLFNKVNHQPINNLPKHQLVYWGFAFINHISISGEKKSHYQIRFGNGLSYSGDSKITSFLIDKKLVDEDPKNPLSESLKENVGKSRSVRVFLYSESPYFNSTASGDYINFRLKGLDHLDIRSGNLFNT